MSVRVEPGDMLEVIPRLVAEGVVCDAVVTDPPYHLVPTQKRFGAANSAPAQYGRAGAMARLSGGFMGKSWDGGDIAFRPETWAAVYTILRPGAFLVAFGGTRTFHRLACAIEDAGFIIQDSILSLIASDARVQRFVQTLTPAQTDAFSGILDDLQFTGALAWVFGSGFPKRRDMLKPAFEPICLAYKPGGKRTLQVDECRIGTNGEAIAPRGSSKLDTNMQEGWARPWMQDRAYEKSRHDAAIERANTLGRWPANLCHDGSDDVLQAFPDAPGQLYEVGPQHGDRKSVNVYGNFGPRPLAIPRRDREESAARRYTDSGSTDFAALPGARRSDPGSSARFFYCAKADAQDRWGSRHPTVKPVELMKWLVPLVTPPGGLVIDPFAGSGTTGVAALATGRDAILIERESEYLADIRERLAHYEGEGRHSLSAKARRTPQKPDEGLFAEVAE